MAKSTLPSELNGAAQWSSTAGSVPNIADEDQIYCGHHAAVNVTYGTVDDPDRCECIFCPPLSREMGALWS